MLYNSHTDIFSIHTRGVAKTTQISKMESFVTIVYGLKLLAIVAKLSILHVSNVLATPLHTKACAQKSWKLTCPGFDSVTPLLEGALLTSYRAEELGLGEQWLPGHPHPPEKIEIFYATDTSHNN